MTYSAISAVWAGSGRPMSPQVHPLSARTEAEAEAEAEALALPAGRKLWAVGETETVRRNCKV